MVTQCLDPARKPTAGCFHLGLKLPCLSLAEGESTSLVLSFQASIHQAFGLSLVPVLGRGEGYLFLFSPYLGAEKGAGSAFPFRWGGVIRDCGKFVHSLLHKLVI